MGGFFSAARGLVPDKFTIARVRARGDNLSTYLVQVSGRDSDFLAKTDERLSPGTDVLVMLEPNVHAPVILGLSPWRACFQVVANTNNGDPWEAADIVAGQLDAAIAANGDQAANLAAVHDRLHSMTSTADHSNVSGTASNGTLMVFDGTAWQPRAVAITLDGGTR